MCKDYYFQTIFNFEGPVKGPVEGPVEGPVKGPVEGPVKDPVKLLKYVITSTGFGSLERLSGHEQDIEDE